jgi:hypothetical protein
MWYQMIKWVLGDAKMEKTENIEMWGRRGVKIQYINTPHRYEWDVLMVYPFPFRLD